MPSLYLVSIKFCFEEQRLGVILFLRLLHAQSISFDLMSSIFLKNVVYQRIGRKDHPPNSKAKRDCMEGFQLA